MTSSRWLKLALSVGIGVVCLWFALRDLSWDATSAQIRLIPWWGHVGYVGFMFAQFLIRSWRWRLQAEAAAGQAIPFRKACAINAVGFTAVFLIPLRLGEFVRPMLSQQAGLMSASTGLAHSAVERVLDGLITTAFFGMVLLLIGDTVLPDEVLLGGWLALLLFGGASVAAIVALRARERSMRFWRRLLGAVHQGFADKAVGLLDGFVGGLSCFRSRRDLLLYVVASVGFWAVNGISIWFLMRSMGVDVSPLVAYFTVCFLVIGVMLPAPPGNVGNFHYFARLGMTLLGVSTSVAMATALVLHAWQVASLLLWTGFWLLFGEVDLTRVRSQVLRGGPAVPTP